MSSFDHKSLNHFHNCIPNNLYCDNWCLQKVMACRRELVEYDQQQREAVAAKGQVPVPTGAKPKVASVENKSSKASLGSDTSKREWYGLLHHFH